MELQRGHRMPGALAPLATRIVRVPDDAARVVALDQHDARGRPTVGTDGRERHRVRLGQLRVERLAQPAIELIERVFGRGALVELGALVALAQRAEIVHAGKYRKSLAWRRCHAMTVRCRTTAGKALGNAPTTSKRPQLPCSLRSVRGRATCQKTSRNARRF